MIEMRFDRVVQEQYGVTPHKHQSESGRPAMPLDLIAAGARRTLPRVLNRAA